MIPCTEVRIGNYILIDNDLKQVTLINKNEDFPDAPVFGYVGLRGRPSVCNNARAQPVPLTDTVLQQCGFTFNNHLHSWQITPSGSGPDIDKEYNVIDFMRQTVIPKLTSLHQLQNAFFALKGRELPFSGDAAAETAGEPEVRTPVTF